ncbi:MAG: alanine racemase [bacterium]
MKITKPAWIEVYLKNCAHNINEVKKCIDENTKICAVVKADGYKLGSTAVAKEYIKNGAYMLAIASLDEGIELRKEIKDTPILVLGYTPDNLFKESIDYNLTLTIYSEEQALKVQNIAKKLDQNVKIHVKIETGMNRLGFKPDGNSIKIIKNLYEDDNINLEGIYSHLAKADERDKTSVFKQKKIFDDFLSILEEEKINIPLKHISNSAAIIDLPSFNYDMVRPGIMLTGLYPSDEVDKSKVNLKQAFSLKVKIANVKWIDVGEGVSYGHQFIAKEKTKVATLPIGYSNGFTRLLTDKMKVSFNGQKCSLIGRVCMDQCMINVSHIDDIKIGDIVTIYGNGQSNTTTIEEVAKLIGTINYEIITMLDRGLPKIYK